MSYVRVLFGILVWGMSSCVMASSLSEDLVESASAAVTSPTSSQIKRVVFDIDEFICWKTEQEDIAAVKQRFPECIVIDVIMPEQKYKNLEGELIVNPEITYPHVFGPYMECVFDYLRMKGWRTAFFSSSVAERNEPLIQSYFSQLLGADEYHKLYKQGQYRVYSKHHLSEGTLTLKVKDLHTTLSVGESIDNTILGEDDASYAAKGQEFMIKGRYADNIFGNAVLHGHSVTYFDRQHIDQCMVLAMNHTYFILGILDFCSEFMIQDSTLSLRGALQKTLTIALPKKGELFNRYHEFNDLQTYIFLKRGLKIVQKKHPSARFYIPKNERAKNDLLKVMKAANDRDDVSSVSSLDGFDRSDRPS